MICCSQEATHETVDTTEIICESDIDIEPYIKAFTVFKDTNGDKIVNHGEIITFKFRLKVFVSRDPGHLDLAYDKNNPEPEDICIFIEDNSGDILSARAGRIKIGSAFKNNLKELTSVNEKIKNKIVESIDEFYKDLDLDFEAEELESLIQTGALENASGSFIISLLQAVSTPISLSYFLNKGVGEGMTSVADFLKKYIKFQPEHWDPEAKVKKDPDDDSKDAARVDNPNFEPILFPFSKTLTGTVADNLESVVKEFSQILEQKDVEILARIEQLDTIASGVLGTVLSGAVSPILRPFAQNILSGQIVAQYKRVSPYIKQAIQKIGELLGSLDDVLNQGLNVVNAFICGLWNSIADILVGIFDLLGLLFKAIAGGQKALLQAGKKLPELLETIDSFIQFTIVLDYPAIMIAVFNGVKSIDFSGFVEKITAEKVAYYIGAFIGFVVSMIIEALLTGGIKNVQSIISRIGSLAENMLGFMQRAITTFFGKSLKQLGDDLVGLFVKITDFLRKGTDEIVKLIQRFFDELKRAAQKGRAVLEFAASLTRALKKLGVSWTDEIINGLDVVKVVQTIDGKTVPVFTGPRVDFFSALEEFNRIGRVNTKVLKRRLDELATELNRDLLKFLEDKGYSVVRKSRSTKNLDIVDKKGFIIFRGTKDEILKFENFIRKSRTERKALLSKTNKAIKSKNSDKIYNPEVAKSKGIDIPRSKNGTSPNFKGLKKYLNEDGKLGNGKLDIGISSNNLEDALKKINKFDGEVKIPITGLDRGADFQNCWKAMGIDPSIGAKLQDKLKITWHHLDDLDVDLESTMQLVVGKTHFKTLQHLGSHAQIKELLDIK